VPNRILRDGILESRAVSALTPMAELLYRKLMSVVDDYGRWHGDAALVRSRCYPLCPEQRSVEDVERDLVEISTPRFGTELVTRYIINGKKVLQINNFGQRQRSASKFPTPPADNCAQMPADNGHMPADDGHMLADDGQMPADDGHMLADDGQMPADDGHPLADDGGPRTSARNCPPRATRARVMRAHSESYSNANSDATTTSRAGGGVPPPKPSSSSLPPRAPAHWPATAAAVRERFPLADDAIVSRIIDSGLDVSNGHELTDQLLAAAVRHSYRPSHRGPAVLVPSVRSVLYTHWRQQTEPRASPSPPGGGKGAPVVTRADGTVDWEATDRAMGAKA
jgi:hypothetical protein